MNQKQSARTGGQILVDQLLIQGVERITCVPGESYLAALDAMHDVNIDILICRHEGGAAMMAEAYGKLTGRPGICFVTRGPGATNAAHGVHIAAHDSTPLILFVGQAERGI
ncbi:MAG TPA: thiamine pyrophosphate-binding protein, partial [Pirellula sp.]|nr:thiamine pyrophosphate-binding protein [Pirellula sp.]